MKAARCKIGAKVRIRERGHPFYGRVGEITDVMRQLVWVAIDDFQGGGRSWRSCYGNVRGSSATIPFEITEVGSACVVDALAELVEDD